MEKPVPNVMSRVKTSFSWGPVIGLWALFYTIIEGIVIMLADIFLPEQDIDITRSFDQTNYNIDPLAFGNHELYVDPSDLRDKNKKPEQIIIDQNFKNTKLPGKRNHKNRYRTILHPSNEPVSQSPLNIVTEPAFSAKILIEKSSCSEETLTETKSEEESEPIIEKNICASCLK